MRSEPKVMRLGLVISSHPRMYIIYKAMCVRSLHDLDGIWRFSTHHALISQLAGVDGLRIKGPNKRKPSSWLGIS